MSLKRTLRKHSDAQTGYPEEHMNFSIKVPARVSCWSAMRNSRHPGTHGSAGLAQHEPSSTAWPPYSTSPTQQGSSVVVQLDESIRRVSNKHNPSPHRDCFRLTEKELKIKEPPSLLHTPPRRIGPSLADCVLPRVNVSRARGFLGIRTGPTCSVPGSRTPVCAWIVHSPTPPSL